MIIIATYEGYDDEQGMMFSNKTRIANYIIRDGEMSLKIGMEYKITAYEFNVGSYGDDVIITDYSIDTI